MVLIWYASRWSVQAAGSDGTPGRLVSSGSADTSRSTSNLGKMFARQ